MCERRSSFMLDAVNPAPNNGACALYFWMAAAVTLRRILALRERLDVRSRGSRLKMRPPRRGGLILSVVFAQVSATCASSFRSSLFRAGHHGLLGTFSLARTFGLDFSADRCKLLTAQVNVVLRHMSLVQLLGKRLLA